MECFIDKSTGTWGLAEDIVFVYLTPDEADTLDGMSDSGIIAFAESKT